MNMDIVHTEQTAGVSWMLIALITFIGVAVKLRTNPSASVAWLVLGGSVGAALAATVANVPIPRTAMATVLAASATVGAMVYAGLSVAVVLSRQYAARRPALSTARYAVVSALSAACGALSVVALLAGLLAIVAMSA